MNAHTALAIETFGKIERAKRRIDRLEAEHRNHLFRMPEEDRVAYFEATEDMIRRYEP